MFDFSFLELLIIGVITLIVVGPDRLPGLMRTVGFWVGRARATVASLRSEFEREVNASGLRETERHIRKGVADTEREVQAATDIGAPRDIGGGAESKGPAAAGVGDPPPAAAESEQVRWVDTAPEAPVGTGDVAGAADGGRAGDTAPAADAGVAGKEQR